METNRLEQLPPERVDTNIAAPSPAPAREQRMRALRHANQIRTDKATLKHDLAAGRTRIEDVLTHLPACATNAKVSELLRAIPGFGPTRATRALARCQIPYTKTAASLSERQRVALIALLASR